MPAAQVVVTASHGVGLSPGRASDPRSKMTKYLAKGAEWGPGNARNVLAAVFLTKKKCAGCVKMGNRKVTRNAYLTTRGSVSHDTGWRISKHVVAYLKTRGSLSRKLTGGPEDEKVDRKNRSKKSIEKKSGRISRLF